MLSERMSSCVFAALLISLAVLALAPWGVKALFDPLQPDELAKTPLAYKPTEVAHATREAETEIAAPSTMVIWTPEGTEFPQAITMTPTPSTDIVTVPDEITGTVSQDTPVFSCPYPSEQTDMVWPPNQEFTVLGWNIDLDNVVYLLVEDVATQPQKWLQLGPEVTLSFADYRVLYPVGAACRTWTTSASPTPADTVQNQDGEVITPTIPLPVIKTATPLPPEAIQIELTNEDATNQVEQEIPELKNPSVYFSPDEVRITGTVEASTPLGSIDGNLEITGTLELRDGKLHFQATSVTARGRDYTDDSEGRDAESAVNAWLAKLMIRRDAESFELLDGMLVINAVEYQESALPTLAPTPISTAVNNAEGETAESQAEMTPTAVPLPEAQPITATPQPARSREITDGQATLDAVNNLSAIVNPSIQFTSSGVVIVGEFTSPVAIPGQNAMGTVNLSGGLAVENGRLQMRMRNMTFNGVDITHPVIQETLGTAVNGWLPGLHQGMAITDFTLSDGTLTLLP